MSERVRLKVKNHDRIKENSVAQMRKPFPSQSITSSADRILFLQRTTGNHAVQRLLKSGTLQAKLRISQPTDLYEQEADRVADEIMHTYEPDICLRPVRFLAKGPSWRNPAKLVTPLLQREENKEEEEDPELKKLLSTESLKRYKNLKNRLQGLRKRSKIDLIKTIYKEVLDYNPFTIIDVKSITKEKQTKQIEGQTYEIITTSNAVTEWADDKDHSKGIKVTFEEELFKDPVEEIISTALHEAVHARQLEKGVPYSLFATPGREKNYKLAVAALSELDAYTIEINSPFFETLSKERKEQVKGFFNDAEKEAIKQLDNISEPLIYKPYQNALENILPRFKGLQKQRWFDSHPLPWKAKK